MEVHKKKCSLTNHSEIDTISFCQECKIFLCNKCKNHHDEIFENHEIYNLDKKENELFSDICKYKNHINKLEFFCKTHNQLCCLACICKIESEGYNQHKNCNVCKIKDIENEKKNKLKENLKSLEDLSNNLEQSINELKQIFEKFNENKENLKLNIQKIFTKIRNCLNDREDELLIEVDKQYDNIYCNEEIIKECEKLPNKTKIYIEKGRKIEKEWNENKLISLINDCINIENNIKEINIIKEKLNIFNLNKKEKIKFNIEEKEMNQFLKNIKIFGKIMNKSDFKYKFKKCPNNIKEERKFRVSGEKENILTKNGEDCVWTGTLCEDNFDEIKEYKYKIKILNSRYKNIMVGVAPIDFDINSSLYSTHGWYLFCFYGYKNPPLFSGPPFNYEEKATNINKIKDEIIIVMNMKTRSLKFIIDNEDKGESYTNIPIEKPIFPAVLLFNQNDSIEISEC